MRLTTRSEGLLYVRPVRSSSSSYQWFLLTSSCSSLSLLFLSALLAFYGPTMGNEGGQDSINADRNYDFDANSYNFYEDNAAVESSGRAVPPETRPSPLS